MSELLAATSPLVKSANSEKSKAMSATSQQGSSGSGLGFAMQLQEASAEPEISAASNHRAVVKVGARQGNRTAGGAADVPAAMNLPRSAPPARAGNPALHAQTPIPVTADSALTTPHQGAAMSPVAAVTPVAEEQADRERADGSDLVGAAAGTAATVSDKAATVPTAVSAVDPASTSGLSGPASGSVSGSGDAPAVIVTVDDVDASAVLAAPYAGSQSMVEMLKKSRDFDVSWHAGSGDSTGRGASLPFQARNRSMDPGQRALALAGLQQGAVTGDALNPAVSSAAGSSLNPGLTSGLTPGPDSATSSAVSSVPAAIRPAIPATSFTAAELARRQVVNLTGLTSTTAPQGPSGASTGAVMQAEAVLPGGEFVAQSTASGLTAYGIDPQIPPVTVSAAAGGMQTSVMNAGPPDALQLAQSLVGEALPMSDAPDNMFLASTSGTIPAPPVMRGEAATPAPLYAPATVPLLTPEAEEALTGNVRWMVRDGVQNALINVTPGGIGPISVREEIENDKMSVSIIAIPGQTRDALETMLPRLREHLSSQGFDSVKVDVSDGRQEGSRGNQQQHAGQARADGSNSGSSDSSVAQGGNEQRSGSQERRSGTAGAVSDMDVLAGVEPLAVTSASGRSGHALFDAYV
jgi:flagellar hook-length control protein FliK